MITDPFPEIAEDVYEGLTAEGQKELPAKYLYDTLGSALFEAITHLPEYGLTRADLRLIERHAGEICRHAAPTVVVELGSGGGGKARGILKELSARISLAFYPVDVSKEALRQCRLALMDVPNVEIHPVEATYIPGLRSALRRHRQRQAALVLFLGSTIGNFTPMEAVTFLRDVRQELSPGDHLLFSADLEKDESLILRAYSDPLGVTAAFNLNVLGRLNRELNAGFDLSRFEHVALYDRKNRRIEMHLRSRVDQLVSVGGFQAGFRKGETIRTEYSYKFRLADIQSLCDAAGWCIQTQWIDRQWPLAQTLCRIPA